MIYGSHARTNYAQGRKREILEAALKVVAKGGADSVTHRSVADVAQVPLGSLTYYFESREDLIREAFRLYIAEAMAFLLELQRDVPPSTPTGLVDMILELMAREFASPDSVRAEYEMILHAARDRTVAHEFAAWERSLEEQLAVSLSAMGTRQPQSAARTIVQLVRGSEIVQIAGRSESPRELRNRLLTVVNALIPAEKAAPQARAISAKRRSTR